MYNIIRSIVRSLLFVYVSLANYIQAGLDPLDLFTSPRESKAKDEEAEAKAKAAREEEEEEEDDKEEEDK